MRYLSYRTSWISCLLVIVLAGSGCTRKFYRKRTDDDVVGLLTQKNQFPQWGIEAWHIYPDPRSRFADVSNPDRPPKPPDDLASYLLSPDPQPRGPKKTALMEGNGYMPYLEAWDAENRAKRAARPIVARGQSAFYASVEATSSESYDKALKTQEKPFLLKLDQAAELSLFNSREFQDRREDLYVAALPVTAERFSFVSQFFATEKAVREVTGSKTVDGPGSRWKLDTNTGFTKLFPTGATLLVQLANRLVIELGGNGKPTVSLSNLTAELTQPLLQGGGYAVTMEPLTQAERNLLYAVRSYARFRAVYYTFLAGGNDNLFNSPYSYAGLSLRGIGPTLAAPSQGYYPTILLSYIARNEEENIAGLERYWKVYQAFEEGGDVSKLQVDQVEQQLLGGRSRLLQRRLDVQNALDSFKIQLGLPTPLPLELDDGPMQPLADHLARYTAARDEFDTLRKIAGDYPEMMRRPFVPLDVPLRPRLREFFVETPAVRGTRFRAHILNRWLRWERFDDKEIRAELLKLAADEREVLELKARVEVENKKLSSEDEERLARFRSEINLGRFELILRQHERRPWLKEPIARRAREQANSFREVLNLFTLVLGEAREERLDKIHLAWPDLPSVSIEGVDLLRDDLDKSQTIAAQTALGNRLELMNARSQLVDAWRQVAVRANSLLGVLNVGYHYDTTSPPGTNQPFNLGDGRSRHQLLLNGELPLVRQVQRNDYRVSLISFQRQRRALQANEDFVLNDVRAGLRQLRVLAENYKIQQRAVEVAYAQVENSLDVLQSPPDPRAAASGQSAGNAAA
ncbi:MAG: TolC family protein, partial [Planctomycetes bacterium]|nr:TolC family protein [Planctomycetota bacterium]